MTIRPRVATVLTARDWESNLATAARATSAIRLVARAYEPTDLSGDVDVVVAGAETPWVTPSFIKSWRRRGVRVLGLHPQGDLPARRMLEMGAADAVRPDTTSSLDLVHLARVLGLDDRHRSTGGRIIVITGPHGAPGRTEVALALAEELSTQGSTLLLDLDIDAPSVSMRLGLPPSPSISEAEAVVRARGEIPETVIHRAGEVNVVIGDLGGSRPDPTMLSETAIAASSRAEFVVIDTAAWRPDDHLIAGADATVLVCDASPVGLIRGAKVALHWSGPPPALVLNRLTGDVDDIIGAARRAIGLEPAALIPHLAEIRTASVSTLPPVAALRGPLRKLAGSLRAAAQ